MTVAHVGMILEGLFLLSFTRMDWPTVVVCALWFGLSDWMDYGPFQTYPHFPTHVIPFAPVQWHTVGVTVLLTVLYAYMAWRRARFLSADRRSLSKGPASGASVTKETAPVVLGHKAER